MGRLRKLTKSFWNIYRRMYNLITCIICYKLNTGVYLASLLLVSTKNEIRSYIKNRREYKGTIQYFWCFLGRKDHKLSIFQIALTNFLKENCSIVIHSFFYFFNLYRIQFCLIIFYYDIIPSRGSQWTHLFSSICGFSSSTCKWSEFWKVCDTY